MLTGGSGAAAGEGLIQAGKATVHLCILHGGALHHESRRSIPVFGDQRAVQLVVTSRFTGKWPQI